MYLLLRNNKQSGPYSMEELKSMGLKAYDLVWLEGKSAAWRYPSEIEELKSFSPAVEEQPFDRFYRRPASTTTASNTAGTTLSSKAPSADIAIPVTVESAKAPGKRIIYVTMPAARTTAAAAPQREPLLVREAAQPVREAAQLVHGAAQSVSEPAQPVQESTLAVRESTQAAREAFQPTREPGRPVEPSPLYEDHVAAPEPIRPIQTGPRVIEDYTAHQAQDQTIIEEFFPHKRRSSGALRLLTIAICILALLTAGIIIGLNLNKTTLGFPSRVVAKIPPSATDQGIVHPTAEHLPAPAATVPALTGDPGRSADTVPTVVEQPNPTSPRVTRATARSTNFKSQKERPAHSPGHMNGLPPVKDSAAGADLANAVHRADVAEPYHSNQEIADKEAVKAALASQVSVGANGYSVGTFGGITDLQLTVTNRSVYPLDLVIVEVQYIQANKKIYKTEDLYFHGIAAGSALMQEAPKSSRGVRVQYKIMTITSKEIAYSYSGI